MAATVFMGVFQTSAARSILPVKIQRISAAPAIVSDRPRNRQNPKRWRHFLEPKSKLCIRITRSCSRNSAKRFVNTIYLPIHCNLEIGYYYHKKLYFSYKLRLHFLYFRITRENARRCHGVRDVTPTYRLVSMLKKVN